MTRPRCASTVTANLLAEVVAVDVFKADELRNAFAGAHRREIEARIFEHTKRTVGIHVYLTDSKGVVVFDSDGGRRYAERYIQTLTHEMKSPLAAIRGAAELLDEEMPVEVRKRFLENIRAETARSERLINRLLELAAIEGRTSLETAGEVDFHAIVARAIDQARPLAEVAGVQLADRAEASPVLLCGDSFILRAAVTNLLENAIDFSPRGGAVDIDVESTGGNVVLSVRDHGPGVPDYAREKVFERFYSLRHLSAKRKGTGLGLTLVRETAELHGGTITLEPAAGGGTVARLTLPLA